MYYICIEYLVVNYPANPKLALYNVLYMHCIWNTFLLFYFTTRIEQGNAPISL